MSNYRDDFRQVQREYFWTVPRALLMILVAVIGLGAIGWLAQGNQFFLYKIFAPQYEAVRRDVQIESRAYTEATIRNLYAYRRQYLAAKTDDERAALKNAALHEFGIFPQERLPADLRAWMIALQSN